MGIEARPALIALRNIGITGVFGVACYGGYRYVLKFGHLNPFEKLEGKVSSLDPNTSILLNDVQLRDYRNGKLITKAQVDQLDVSKDRTRFGLTGIKNGMYMSSKGPVQYAGKNGVYNASSQNLQVSGGARFKGDQFDIQSPLVSFDKQKELLTSPAPLSGNLYGGRFNASTLDFNLSNSSAHARFIRWQGKVDSGKSGAGQQVPGDTVGPHLWDITGDDWKTIDGKDYYENGIATDGVVIVKAPHIVHDKKTDIITATGRVTYFSAKADMIADQAVIHRKEKWAVFTGDVRMLIKPKKDQDMKPKEEEILPIKPEVPATIDKTKVSVPNTLKTVGVKTDDASPLTDEQKQKDKELRSGQTVRDYPMQVQSDKITYWYEEGNRHAHIEGKPAARQELTDARWRQVWSFEAFYDGEKDTMELRSDANQSELQAHLKNSIGDDMWGKTITFSTKEGLSDDDEDVKAKQVRMHYVDRDQETPDTKGDKKSTPPLKTGGG